MKATRFAPLLLLALCGCAAAGPVARTTTGTATLTLTPRFQASGYAAQAVVPQVDATRVNHVVLALSRVTSQGETPVLTSSGAPVTADLIRWELDTPFTFTNLAANVTYRVRASAYEAPGTDEGDLISIPEQSYVDVPVLGNDQPTMAPLTVRLVATPFAATAAVTLSATGSVLFTALDVGFYALAGNVETLLATRSLPADEVPSTVSFDNLQGMSTYRLKAQAKDLNGQAIAGADAQMDVEVDDDTEVATAALEIAIP